MKTVLVTGANKGIGREIARQLVQKGLRVFVGARNVSAGEKAAQEIGAEFLALDVSQEESVKTAANDLAQRVDVLDVLVNNAGIMLDGDKNVLRNTDELFRETFETNTLGPVRVTRAFAPLLRKSETPRVINVSSSGGQLDGGADGWAPAYCISKTALNGVTVQLAAALPKFAVNSVCPGWVRTDMGGSNARLSVEEGADTIVWLATDAPQELTARFIKERKEIPW